MTVVIVLKLLHVLASFALVGGEIGRAIVFERAKKSTDLKVVAEMLQLFTFFNSKLISPGGLLAFLLGLATAGSQGKTALILGFLAGGEINWPLASIILYVIVMILVFTLTIPRGKVMRQALGAALSKGKITPELTAAMNDKAFNANFIIQDVLIVLIVILMVLKPF